MEHYANISNLNKLFIALKDIDLPTIDEHSDMNTPQIADLTRSIDDGIQQLVKDVIEYRQAVTNKSRNGEISTRQAKTILINAVRDFVLGISDKVISEASTDNKNLHVYVSKLKQGVFCPYCNLLSRWYKTEFDYPTFIDNNSMIKLYYSLKYEPDCNRYLIALDPKQLNQSVANQFENARFEISIIKNHERSPNDEQLCTIICEYLEEL